MMKLTDRWRGRRAPPPVLRGLLHVPGPVLSIQHTANRHSSSVLKQHLVQVLVRTLAVNFPVPLRHKRPQLGVAEQYVEERCVCVPLHVAHRAVLHGTGEALPQLVAPDEVQQISVRDNLHVCSYSSCTVFVHTARY